MVIAVVVLAPTLAVVAGSSQLPVCTRQYQSCDSPLWAYTPVLVGVAIAVSLAGSFPEIDQSAARHLGAYKACYLITVVAAAALAIVAVLVAATALGLVVSSTPLATALVRNTLGWVGCTVLVARLFGSPLSWVGAVVATFVFEWFGRGASGTALGWAFAIAATTESWSWVVATSLMLAAIFMTVWGGTEARLHFASPTG